MDLTSGNKEVFVSGNVVGKVGALANDGAGNLLALDWVSGRLFRINPKNLAISVVAQNLSPVGGSCGSYPVVEFPSAMAVGPKGDIYIPTFDRGLIMLQKIK